VRHRSTVRRRLLAMAIGCALVAPIAASAEPVHRRMLIPSEPESDEREDRDGLFVDEVDTASPSPSPSPPSPMAFPTADSFIDERLRALKRPLAIGTVAAAHAGLIAIALASSDGWGGELELGGDGMFEPTTHAGGADKLQQAWGTMALTRASSRVLRWGGVRRVPAALVGAGLSWSALLVHETADGYATSFSPGDVLGNSAGAALGVALELSPALDRLIDYRVQYWPNGEYAAAHPDAEVRNPFADYGAQTHLLALHVGELPGMTRHGLGWTRYTDLVLGFRARNTIAEDATRTDTVRQSAYVGVAVNVATVAERLFGRRARPVAALTEVVDLFPALPLVGVRRGGAD